MLSPAARLEVFLFVPIQRQEDKDEDGKRPEGRTAVAQKRQGDADDGHQADRKSVV